MNTQERNRYQDVAALVAMTDNTGRISLSGSAYEKKEQLAKELGEVSVAYGSGAVAKPRKARN